MERVCPVFINKPLLCCIMDDRLISAEYNVTQAVVFTVTQLLSFMIECQILIGQRYQAVFLCDVFYLSMYVNIMKLCVYVRLYICFSVCVCASVCVRDIIIKWT